MATVYFYEKPGCVNNNRQKQLLEAAGHRVIAKNLLTESWQIETLRPFFGELPIAEWFNYSAPAIKYGEVHPEQLTESQALSLLLTAPLLIRRPLMQVGETRMAGFDQQKVAIWIGLANSQTEGDLQTCSRTAASTVCHDD